MHYHPPQALSILDQALREAQQEIRRMPGELLQKLNTRPPDLSRFIDSLPSVQTLTNRRRELRERNRHLAMRNLQKEPNLLSARQKLSELFAQLAPLRDEYLRSRSAKQVDSPSPTLIVAQLQSAVHANERSNDEMIEVFLHTRHNDHDMDRFIKNFLRDRQETIELRCLSEKFFDLYELEKRKK